MICFYYINLFIEYSSKTSKNDDINERNQDLDVHSIQWPQIVEYYSFTQNRFREHEPK